MKSLKIKIIYYIKVFFLTCILNFLLLHNIHGQYLNKIDLSKSKDLILTVIDVDYKNEEVSNVKLVFEINCDTLQKFNVNIGQLLYCLNKDTVQNLRIKNLTVENADSVNIRFNEFIFYFTKCKGTNKFYVNANCVSNKTHPPVIGDKYLFGCFIIELLDDPLMKFYIGESSTSYDSSTIYLEDFIKYIIYTKMPGYLNCDFNCVKEEIDFINFNKVFIAKENDYFDYENIDLIVTLTGKKDAVLKIKNFNFFGTIKSESQSYNCSYEIKEIDSMKDMATKFSSEILNNCDNGE